MPKPNYKNLRDKRTALAKYLMANPGFRKARQIEDAIGMDPRLVRELCSQYPRDFFSTNKGYKLTRWATDLEIQEGIADLRSRIKHLDERASVLERVVAERLHGRQGVLL